MTPVYIVGAQRSPIAKVRAGNLNTSSISVLQPKDLAMQVLDQLFIETSGSRRLPNIEFTFRLGSAVSKFLETKGMLHAPAKRLIEGTLWKNAHCIDALLIGEACATGLLAVLAGVKDIISGCSILAVTGGVDMMSRHPDGAVSKILLDLHSGKNMAALADSKAIKLGITKEEQENYAFSSYQRARQHLNDHDLVQIFTDAGGSASVVPALTVDEGAAREPSLEIIKRTKTLPDCTINSSAFSSKYGDGAAFLSLAPLNIVLEHNMAPLGKIIGYGFHSEAEPEDFIIAPIKAIKKAVAMAGLRIEDIDFFEINEAFASTVLATMKALNISHEKVNPWGGAIAHGHPIGATGAILVVKILTILKKHQKRYGVVALCSAIAEGVACVIEKI